MNRLQAAHFERLQRRARLAVRCAIGASIVAVLVTGKMLEPNVRAGIDAAVKFPSAVAQQLVAWTSVGAAHEADPIAVAALRPGAASHQAPDHATRPVEPPSSPPRSSATATTAAAPPDAGDVAPELAHEGLAPGGAPGDAATAQATDNSKEDGHAPELRADPSRSDTAAGKTPPAPDPTPKIAVATPAPSGTAALGTPVPTVASAPSPSVVTTPERSPPESRSVALSFSSSVGVLGSMPVIVAPMPFWIPTSAPGNTLEVRVKKLHSQRGRVHCTIFIAPGVGFPWQKNLAQGDINVAIDDKSPGAIDYDTSCTFVNVPRGTYAVSVFHDENDNGRFDRDWTSTPIDGRGASNNAKGGFGPVRFSDASFSYAGGAQSLFIDIDYISQ